jgi:hypothetical protein
VDVTLDLSSGWCGFGWFIPVVRDPDDSLVGNADGESSRGISAAQSEPAQRGATDTPDDGSIGPH